MADSVVDGMTWDVWIRDRSGQRVALATDYGRVSATLRHNAVGSFAGEGIPTHSPAGVAVQQPGAGVEVEPSGGPVAFSGPITRYNRKIRPSSDTVDISGSDDMVWLSARLAHPQPFTAAPPYNVAPYDVISGPAVAVMQQLVDRNAGPSALPSRQVPGLTIRADNPAGETVTARGRWQPVIQILEALAATTRLTFRVDGLEFSVDSSDADPHVFAQSLGNTEGFDLGQQWGGPNWAVVGGAGELIDRVIGEAFAAGPIEQFGRWETFVDKRDVDTGPEMEAAGFDALTKTASELPTVTVLAVESPGSRYGIDYRVGSPCRIDVDGLSMVDVVREASIELSAEGVKIRPKVGARVGLGRLATVRAIADLSARVGNLERR